MPVYYPVQVQVRLGGLHYAGPTLGVVTLDRQDPLPKYILPVVSVPVCVFTGKLCVDHY